MQQLTKKLPQLLKKKWVIQKKRKKKKKQDNLLKRVNKVKNDLRQLL